ncbi:ITG-like peptide isoform X2 [Odontomachus brunneus]|uniref:ITG-like peptide isoform X2 n=1 Tax=Odontomachus brunneus TaxID=486640 RepID=UPI0013F26C05|nr:ITG-like peptide isoform X2 [Odontomachus brunneus]
MKACAVITTLVLVANTAHIGVEAWGGLFNRFSPEMLSNLGYGGHGSYMNRPGLLQSLSEGYSGMYGEGSESTEEPCYERKCVYNDHCCPGSICVNIDGVVGTCVEDFGMKQGELCRRDNDCETGLMCQQIPGRDARSCQPPTTSNKLYNEECTMSSECDISRGLCCQLQRRHRQTPRKVCSYFKDALVCIGPVATDQIKSVIQYTSGEKRITGQGNRMFKRMPFA